MGSKVIKNAGLSVYACMQPNFWGEMLSHVALPLT